MYNRKSDSFKKSIFRNSASTSVVLLTGTHGENGVTGLTDEDRLLPDFYRLDCKSKDLSEVQEDIC